MTPQPIRRPDSKRDLLCLLCDGRSPYVCSRGSPCHALPRSSALVHDVPKKSLMRSRSAMGVTSGCPSLPNCSPLHPRQQTTSEALATEHFAPAFRQKWGATLRHRIFESLTCLISREQKVGLKDPPGQEHTRCWHSDKDGPRSGLCMAGVSRCYRKPEPSDNARSTAGSRTVLIPVPGSANLLSPVRIAAWHRFGSGS
jgi:hypothetical protein